MSAPEIHIEKARDAKEPPRKRRRSSSSKAEKKAAPAADAPTKRSLLSKDTSSFRHLFSFGDGGGEEKDKGCDVEWKDRDEAPAPTPVPGSIFAKLETAAARVGGNEAEEEQVEEVVEEMEVEVAQGEEYYEAEPVAEPVYVVRDGLAANSHDEVLAMAKRFCGVERSVEDLEREWTEGGRREALREDLRSKRHKRIRGRVLGANAGTKQVH